MITIDCIQGSPEWFAERIGRATSSNFGKIISPTGKASTSKTTYSNKCLAEYLLGKPIESYKSKFMQDGNDLEPIARKQSEFINDYEVELVGFCMLDDKSAGCSPDGLIGKDGIQEIKCPIESTMVSYYLNGFPMKYKPQVQGNLWITERKWCDFHAYNPCMKPFMERIYRDEEYIKALSEAVKKFTDELDKKKNELEEWKMAA